MTKRLPYDRAEKVCLRYEPVHFSYKIVLPPLLVRWSFRLRSGSENVSGNYILHPTTQLQVLIRLYPGLGLGSTTLMNNTTCNGTVLRHRSTLVTTRNQTASNFGKKEEGGYCSHLLLVLRLALKRC